MIYVYILECKKIQFFANINKRYYIRSISSSYKIIISVFALPLRGHILNIN